MKRQDDIKLLRLHLRYRYISLKLTEGECNILRAIATKGLLTKYQIQKETYLRYSVIHETVKRMFLGGLIRVYKKTIFKKTRRPSETYGLTLFGLGAICELCRRRIIPFEKMENVAENYKDLLPILLKLSLFKQYGILGRALLILETAILKTIRIGDEQKYTQMDTISSYAQRQHKHINKIMEEFLWHCCRALKGQWLRSQSKKEEVEDNIVKRIEKAIFRDEDWSVVIRDAELCENLLTTLKNRKKRLLEKVEEIEKMMEEVASSIKK